MATRKREPKFEVGQVVAMLDSSYSVGRIVEFNKGFYRTEGSEVYWRASELRPLTRKEAGRRL